MALLHQVGLRALSVTYEDTFGEYEATPGDFISFTYEGDPIERKPMLTVDTGGQANGTLGVTETQVLTVGFDQTFKTILNPNLVGIVCASMGASENTATAKYNYYTFLSSPASVTLKSRNLLEKYGDVAATHGTTGTGAGIVQYSGVQPYSLAVEADKSGWIKCDVGIRGYAAYKNPTDHTVGTVNDNRVAKASWLRFGDATLKTGTVDFNTPTANTPNFTSTADWKAKLQSFSWSVKANILEGGIYQFGTTATGTTDGTAKEYPFSGYEVSLKAKFMSASTEDATDFWKTREMAQTEFAVQIPIIGQSQGSSEYYTVTALFPRVRVKSCNLVNDNGVLMHDVEFQAIMLPNAASASATVLSTETFLYVTVVNTDTPSTFVGTI